MRLPMAIGSLFADFSANIAMNQPLKKLLYFLPSSTRRIFRLPKRRAIWNRCELPLCRARQISLV